MNYILKYGAQIIFALFIITAVTVAAHCVSTLVAVLVTAIVVLLLLHLLRR